MSETLLRVQALAQRGAIRISARSDAVVGGLLDEEMIMSRKSTKLVREGKYAAEIDVQLIEDDTGWSPYLSTEDATKLDKVRKALRGGDIAAAAKLGRVFELTPVS